MILKMYTSKTVFFFGSFLCLICVSRAFTVEEVRKELGPSKKLASSILFACCQKNFPRPYPVIYCYEAVKKTRENLWMRVEVFLSLRPEEYDLYRGFNEDEVIQQFIDDQTFLNMNFFWKKKDIRLNPFNDTCIGIVTQKDYDLMLNVEKADTFAQWLFVAGMALFYLAGYLATEPFFYYLIGITGGVLLSFGILVYFLLSFMPLKRTTIATVMAGGSGLMLFTMDWILNMTRMVMMKYQIYVTGYVIASATVSFFVCYRYGPVTNPQSIDIIRWCLQLAGAATMLLSSYNFEGVLLLVCVMIVFYYFPFLIYVFKLFVILMNTIKTIVLFLFGMIKHLFVNLYGLLVQVALRMKYMIFGYPPVPFLTRRQFRLQGQIETQNAMEQLYVDYHNHTIDPFEALRRMTPEGRAKMLDFLTRREGHVTNDEKDEHSQNYDGLITDDEDDDNVHNQHNDDDNVHNQHN